MMKTKLLASLAVVLLAIALALGCHHLEGSAEAITAAEEDTLHVAIQEERPRAMDEPVSAFSSEDVTLLARIMQEEDGVDEVDDPDHAWPDLPIMAIGEVVLNRVASPEYPNTIEAVLKQTNPIQYAPVYEAGWDRIKPHERYIELAIRLLAGERVLGDPQVVYQATFSQGRGAVMTWHDTYIGSTTYFCLTSNPGLYAKEGSTT